VAIGRNIKRLRLRYLPGAKRYLSQDPWPYQAAAVTMDKRTAPAGRERSCNLTTYKAVSRQHPVAFHPTRPLAQWYSGCHRTQDYRF
jgi:hypothetical protein